MNSKAIRCRRQPAIGRDDGNVDGLYRHAAHSKAAKGLLQQKPIPQRIRRRRLQREPVTNHATTFADTPRGFGRASRRASGNAAMPGMLSGSGTPNSCGSLFKTPRLPAVVACAPYLVVLAVSGNTRDLMLYQKRMCTLPPPVGDTPLVQSSPGGFRSIHCIQQQWCFTFATVR